MNKAILKSISILAFAFSTSTFADDGKIFPGAECQRHSGSTSYNHSSGIIRNLSSTQSLTVVCPITREYLSKSINDGWIKVVDFHPSQNFTCSVKSKHRSNAGGWTNYWSGNRYSAGFGTQTQTLNFGGMGQVSGHSHYYLTCSIPASHSNGSSYILSYRVDENN